MFMFTVAHWSAVWLERVVVTLGLVAVTRGHSLVMTSLPATGVSNSTEADEAAAASLFCSDDDGD